jgi:hypothetical protein
MSAWRSLPNSCRAPGSERLRSSARARLTGSRWPAFGGSVFLAEDAVVFVFEGSGIEGLVRDLVNDPTRSAAFSVWAPLLEGTPDLAREEFHWETGRPQ